MAEYLQDAKTREYQGNIRKSYWNNDIPGWVDGLPSMTHRREKAMYYHLIRDYPGTIGRIVDAGCFAGASTVAFCRGLRDSGRPVSSNMIVSYDLFETDRFSHQVFQQFGHNVPIGASFLPLFLKTIAGHEDMVSIVKGNIMDFGWIGGEIDILFLDVLKSQQLNDHCVRTFFPSLIGGKSLVLHQDYIHDPLPWIPLTMAILDDRFEVLGFCRNTVVFRCTKDVPRALADKVLQDLATMELGEKDRLFGKVLAQFPDGSPNVNLSLSRLWMILYHGDLERARHEIDRFPISEDWIGTKVNRFRAKLDQLMKAA